jgi:hypothetical protein
MFSLEYILPNWGLYLLVDTDLVESAQQRDVGRSFVDPAVQHGDDSMSPGII